MNGFFSDEITTKFKINKIKQQNFFPEPMLCDTENMNVIII